MKALYPVMLQLDGKKIVVVGGGKVAERKVRGLLNTGADVVVVSPAVTEELQEHARRGMLVWERKHFTSADIKDAFMIIAATNDKDLNQYIRDSAGSHQLVTIADDPEGSDFHVPAHFQRGRLSITVSTGGSSPTLAKSIREQLEEQFDESYEPYLEFLYVARQRILHEVNDPSLKRKLLREIASPAYFYNKNWDEELSNLMKNQT